MYRLLQPVRRHVRIRRCVHHEQVGAFGQVEGVRARIGRDLQLTHESAIQATALAHAKHRGSDTRCIPRITARRRNAHRDDCARQLHIVFHHFTHRAFESRRHRKVRTRWRRCIARNRAEILMHQRARLGRIEITSDGQHCIVGRVPGREKLGHILQRGFAEVLHRPDQRVVIRMCGRKRERRKLFPPRAVWLVVHAPASLVLHHVTLRVQLLLRHRRQQAPHAVGLQPQCNRELVARHRLVIIRAIQPGGSVERATSPLHQLEVLVGLDVGRALKKHVLEKMCEACPTFAFVRTAHVVPEVHRDERRDMILRIGDTESVGERLGFNRYLHMPSKIPTPQRICAARSDQISVRRHCVACGHPVQYHGPELSPACEHARPRSPYSSQ